MAWHYTLRELAAAIGAEAPAPPCTFSRAATDSRTLEPGDVFFALKGEHFDGARFVSDAFAKGACAAVTTQPEEAGPCLVVEDPLRALQAFAAWHRRRHALPLIAITGSCGKTSTKDFTAAVLAARYRVVKTQGNLNNEIGCPLSLLQIDDETEMAVIEMGANHTGEIAGLCALAQPTESAITMVGPSHLEGFGTIERVAQAKAEIVDALPKDGTFYVNADDPYCVKRAEAFPGRKVYFGSRGDVRLESCRIEADGEMRLHIAAIGELRLPLACPAHAHNVLLAVAVGLEHGIGLRHGVCDAPRYYEEPLRAACATATRFRIEMLGPITIIDDTYNANPASMAAAFEALVQRPARRRIAVLGDMLELGEGAGRLHREVGFLAGQSGVDHLFLRGDHADDVQAGAREAGLSRVECIQDHVALAEALGSILEEGDVVLVKGSRGMRMEKVIAVLRERRTQES